MQLNQYLLLKRVLATIQFANTSLSDLDNYSDHWSEKETPGNKLKDKVIAETALLWYEASEIPNPPLSLSVALVDLAKKLRKEASHNRIKIIILRAPHSVLWLGLAHILLSRRGVLDPEMDIIVQRALNIHHCQFRERLPFREMDARWVRGIAFEAVPLFDDILPLSILMSKSHPIYMTRDDAYALTHSLMYLTDFGRRNDFPSSFDFSTIESLIDATITWQVWSDDLDLVAELLLCNHLLRRKWSPYAEFAWHVLEFAWSRTPLLPGPFFDEKKHAALGSEKAAAYKFEHSYHTAYVGGLLCTILLRYPMCTNTINVESTPIEIYSLIRSNLTVACHNSAYDLQQFVARHSNVIKNTKEQEDTTVDVQDTCSLAIRVLRCSGSLEDLEALWVEAVDDVFIPVDRLAPVLYDAALIQAVCRYDLPALDRILKEVTNLQLPITPTIVVVTEFLLHQMLPCGVLGAQFVLEPNRSTSIAVVVAHSLSVCLDRLALYFGE